eukprot:c47509_g1_i1 orf=246-611(+)
MDKSAKSVSKSNKKDSNKSGTSPAVKFVDFRATGGKKLAVAGALLGEKLAHIQASLRVALVKLRHPVHPVHRVAATEVARETRAAATERRKQAVAQAQNVAAQKKARARERRARELSHSVF